MTQLVPSHRSATVPSGLPTASNLAPTAVHDDGAVHETSLRKLNRDPAGFGVGVMCQLRPFHCSARGSPAPALVSRPPTAVHDDGDAQATAARKLCRAPGGLGMEWMAHLLPSQRSARVSSAPDLTKNCPTAVHADPDGHDTPLRALAAAPEGFGVDWTVQTPPLRRSASVTPSPDCLTCKPTAVHAEVVGQDTAWSKPFPARGFGLGVIDQPATEAPAGTEALAGIPAAPARTTAAATPAISASRCVLMSASS